MKKLEITKKELKALKKTLGSWRKVAEKVGITERSVYRVLRRNRPPSLRARQALNTFAKIFKTKIAHPEYFKVDMKKFAKIKNITAPKGRM